MFLALYDRGVTPSKPSTSIGDMLRFQMNWYVALAGPVWFFYRKLWLEGVAVLVIPAVVVGAIPMLDTTYVWQGISWVVAFWANPYYIWRARARIAAIEASPLGTDDRDRQLQAKGGVSILGLVVGLLLLTLLAVLIIRAITHQL